VVFGGASLLLILLIGLGLGLRRVARLRASGKRPAACTRVVAAEVDLTKPVRSLPAHFRRNTYLPDIRESTASGAVNPELFSAGRDLVYVDDSRVWWESDNDANDTECDHSVHRSMQAPLRRLIELVDARAGVLEVQDSYRANGVHSSRSLHKEGRAIDITCDELGLEELAKLAWAAGFDWVYYEAKPKGGPHIHASVRRER